jgi:hypothetical protein
MRHGFAWSWSLRSFFCVTGRVFHVLAVSLWCAVGDLLAPCRTRSRVNKYVSYRWGSFTKPGAGAAGVRALAVSLVQSETSPVFARASAKLTDAYPRTSNETAQSSDPSATPKDEVRILLHNSRLMPAAPGVIYSWQDISPNPHTGAFEGLVEFIRRLVTNWPSCHERPLVDREMAPIRNITGR